MKTRYSIGEMSRLFKIPVSTLRHYHNKGVFVAEYTDEESNYRYYSSDQFELLNNIINLRHGKVSLDKIKEFTVEGDVDSLIAAFEEQEDELQKKIDELQEAKQSIKDRRNYLENIKEVGAYGEIIVEEREEEIIFPIRKEFESEEELELLVRELGNQSNFSYSLVLGNVGLIMERKDNYKKYDGVYLKNIDLEEERGEKKKKRRYLVIYFEGCRDDSEGYYKMMEEHIKDKEIEIEGDYYEMALLAKKDKIKKYIRKIEIKIK